MQSCGHSTMATVFVLFPKEEPASSSCPSRVVDVRVAKGLLRRRKEGPTDCRCAHAPLRLHLHGQVGPWDLA